VPVTSRGLCMVRCLLLSVLTFGLVPSAQAAGAAGDPWIGLELSGGKHGGVYINAVVPGAPGERAGLKAGDEVLLIDEHHMETPRQLIDEVRRGGVGHKARLEILGGGGRRRSVTLRYEARPAMQAVQRAQLVDRSAPDFAAAAAAGPKLGSISSLKGHVVLLDFFATWCGPCVVSLPQVEAIHERFGPKGLRVVGISTESAEVVSSAAARFGLKYSLVSDESEAISRSYGIFALPTMVLIDRHGMVRMVSVADEEATEEAVAAALKER
jgi:cytochrome c biogenesis protein CcmG/thiol:disulfide interchange protein DsbE